MQVRLFQRVISALNFLPSQEKRRNSKFKASAPSSSPSCVEAVHLMQQNASQTRQVSPVSQAHYYTAIPFLRLQPTTRCLAEPPPNPGPCRVGQQLVPSVFRRAARVYSWRWEKGCKDRANLLMTMVSLPVPATLPVPPTASSFGLSPHLHCPPSPFSGTGTGSAPHLRC